MAQENGEYTTICDNFLDGYNSKVYGSSGENPYSYTVQKVIIENGKVVSATGEPYATPIKDLGKEDSDGEQNSETSNQIYSGENNIIQGEKNTIENDTKLPKTGEETNTFANGLSIAIIAGIFWLVSMLLIDREKKKINQEQKGSKHND